MQKLSPVKKISLRVLWVALFLCAFSEFTNAIVLHDDNQPPDHPDSNFVGRWGTNASCVVVGKRYVLTTKHQGGGVGTTITIDGSSYIVADSIDIAADIRLVRIKGTQGQLVSLTGCSIYPSLGTRFNQLNKISGSYINIGGFGKIRGAELFSSDIKYGYVWAANTTNTLNWCANLIDDYSTDITTGNKLIVADFDDANAPDDVVSEGASAEYDSGCGWFIQDSGIWKLVGLSYAVDVAGQSWFRSPSDITNPDPVVGDRFYGWWLNDYVGTINDSMAEPSIPSITLTATDDGCGEITIGWDSVINADGYGIYYSSDSPENLVLYGETTTTSATLTGLTPGQDFYIAITARDGIAESDYSNVVIETASDFCPSNISGFITECNLPIPDVNVYASDISSPAISNENGFYQISVPYGWTGTITAAKDYYEFQTIEINEPVISDIYDLNIAADVNKISDNFDDPVRSAKWLRRLSGQGVSIAQPDGRLDIVCDSNDGFGQAEYIANEWLISSDSDFAFKVQFHNELITDVNSGLFVLLEDVNDANYIYVEIGSSAADGENRNYLYMSDFDGNWVDARDVNDGYIYISFSSDNNEVYANSINYGLHISPGYFFQSAEKKTYKLTLGGYAEQGSIPEGAMWFDNFIVNTGEILSAEIRTDINQDGYIDCDDVAELALNWLQNPTTSMADINKDGKVDMQDLAILSNAF